MHFSATLLEGIAWIIITIILNKFDNTLRSVAILTQAILLTIALFLCLRRLGLGCPVVLHDCSLAGILRGIGSCISCVGADPTLLGCALLLGGTNTRDTRLGTAGCHGCANSALWVCIQALPRYLASRWCLCYRALAVVCRLGCID